MSAPAERVFDIAVIPGDGIGVEVIPEGLRVLERLAEQSDGRHRFRFESFPWGSQYYLQTGRMMDPDGLERLQRFDAIYFGAVGWPDVPDHISLWGLRLAICQGFDQYACVRPVRLLPGVPSPLRDATPERIDWVVVRENSEGEYAGIGGRNPGGARSAHEVATQTAIFTAEGCERIIRYAFELARTRKRQKVTSVTKSNAQQYGMALWDEAFDRVRREFPGRRNRAVAGRRHGGPVRAAAGDAGGRRRLQPLRRHPLRSRGARSAAAWASPPAPTSIPSDAATPACSSRSTAAPRYRRPGHRQSDRGHLDRGLMLEHLGLPEEAARVMRAIEATTAAGIVTPDLGGTATTRAVGDAVVASL